LSEKFTSCSGLGIDPARLAMSYVSSLVGKSRLCDFEDRRILFTYQARNALALLCRALRIGPGDEVLVPAYNCGAEIDPYIKNGAKVVMYRIDKELKIDVDDVKRRVTASTRIVHVTHFFGWPQEIDSLARWCREKRILLVEDCAQALFSRGPADTIGKTGDAAVYSFAKSLPVPDGGALVVNSAPMELGIRLGAPAFKVTLRNSIPLVKKWFMNSFVFWQEHAATRRLFVRSWKGNPDRRRDEFRPAMLESNYFVERHMDWAISRVTKGFLRSASRHTVVQKRRKNFQYLLDALRDVPGTTPVFTSLTDGVCPMFFPFIVEDRHVWYAGLDSMGVLVHGWPGYYPGLNWDEYPEACELKDNLLGLPVHQYLGLRHMRHMQMCMKEIARRISSGG
jgi:perosamine synthetase